MLYFLHSLLWLHRKGGKQSIASSEIATHVISRTFQADDDEDENPNAEDSSVSREEEIGQPGKVISVGCVYAETQIMKIILIAGILTGTEGTKCFFSKSVPPLLVTVERSRAGV